MSTPMTPDLEGKIDQMVKERVNPQNKLVQELVFSWPGLFVLELACIVMVTAVIVWMSMVFQAPLEEMANVAVTPNPSKAPWYFLALQELLHYCHPFWAGVFLPGLVLGGLAAIPYFDKNPSSKPKDRRFAIMAFTTFIVLWNALQIVGVAFRGPGWEWVWPWLDGLFFSF